MTKLQYDFLEAYKLWENTVRREEIYVVREAAWEIYVEAREAYLWHHPSIRVVKAEGVN